MEEMTKNKETIYFIYLMYHEVITQSISASQVLDSLKELWKNK